MHVTFPHCRVVFSGPKCEAGAYRKCASIVAGGQIVRVSSKNRPGFHWAIDEGIEGYLMTQAELFKGGQSQPTTLRPSVRLSARAHPKH
jgi:hypothetical protein